MSSKLKELYKQTLLKHSKSPRNCKTLEGASHATLRNPLCGDEVSVYLRSNHTTIEDITFVGQCCAICTASASIMTEDLKGSSIEAANAFARKFVTDFKSKTISFESGSELASLGGVLEYPSRIRCATLPWEAFLDSQKDASE